jgi:hypothetical protein
MFISRRPPSKLQRSEARMTAKQRNWAIRIGLFVVILVVIIVATSK